MHPHRSSALSAVPDRIALTPVGLVLRRYHDSDIVGLYAPGDLGRSMIWEWPPTRAAARVVSE